MKICISSDEMMVRGTVLQFHLDNLSCDSYVNISHSDSPFISFKISHELDEWIQGTALKVRIELTQNLTTLFKCNETSTHSQSVDDYFENYKKYSGCKGFTVYYRNPWHGNLTRKTGHPLPSKCWPIQLPIKATENSSHDLCKLHAYL